MAGVTAATTAASAAASIAAQSKQRSAMNTMEDRKAAAQNDLIAENRRRSTQDYIKQVEAEQLQQRQQEESVAEKGYDIARQTAKTKAVATASAAERNVAGRTISQIVNDYDFQANMEIGRLKENQKLANIQHGQRISGFGTEFENRASSVKPYVKTPAPSVDYFGPIFGAAGKMTNYAVATGAIKPSSTPSAGGIDWSTTPTNEYEYR